ncbi:usherin isoform X3 [Anarrhichthys ocellatus]|uniref:usherin isoform X3 n=1 Tax=Anarrhichthys ocellatus TaxID=433405 RepID=UPI0012EE0E25|nr:usherin-like isoform X3 [Anarrhichthys ocellatus]
MAAIALLLLAIVLGVTLHKALNKPPFTRERPPLVALPMRKRNPMAIYPTGNSVLFDTGPDTTAFSNSVTLKGFTMKIEVKKKHCLNKTCTHIYFKNAHSHGVNIYLSLSLCSPQQEVLEAKCEPIDEVPPQDELEILSVNSLRRSVSQMMDGKSVTGDDEVWDPNISGHDSGMFMDDEEFVDTVKGFSTVRKEHTMFTDTNL